MFLCMEIIDYNFNLEDSVVFNLAIDIPLDGQEYPFLLDYT